MPCGIYCNATGRKQCFGFGAPKELLALLRNARAVAEWKLFLNDKAWP
ncbi:MAG TPA: hypothetical protein VN887_18050 [Candidatus Angelobacter sp.]|nr:hypothetical protein [Candidatus Angelobacter sp.]